jgi:hypothetical protein
MKKPWMFFLIPPVIVLVGWIFGEVVMHLWNWLVPTLFGLHTITFWQGLGLLVLCRILFGGWGSGHKGGHRREKGERWARMTPEEREKFRQNLRGRWCGVGAPPSETSEPA